jgi:hypothetical protein
MAERHRVADVAERRWGPQGLDAAEKLLNRFAPDVVAYAAEETFKTFPHLSVHGSRFWAKVCREHAEGPLTFDSRGRPAERPLTRQQRKVARCAEIAFGPMGSEDDGDEDDDRREEVGAEAPRDPHRPDQMHGRAGA